MAGAALGAAPPGPGPALPVVPPHGAVSVTVFGIRASNEPQENIDPPLQPIGDELRRSRFNSFRVVVNDTRSVAMSQTWDVAMIEDYALLVQPLKETDDTVNVILSWVKYEKVGGRPQARVLSRMSMVIRKGKYFLSGGWRLKEGALMAAVAVK
jgi:hypothetical protein